MNYKTIEVERKGHVSILYLDRPEVLNALSDQMRNELTDFLKEASSDDGVRVLIMTGKGRAFSAGADLNMFKKAYEEFRESGEVGGFGNTELPSAFIHFPNFSSVGYAEDEDWDTTAHAVDLGLTCSASVFNATAGTFSNSVVWIIGPSSLNCLFIP